MLLLFPVKLDDVFLVGFITQSNNHLNMKFWHSACFPVRARTSGNRVISELFIIVSSTLEDANII